MTDKQLILFVAVIILLAVFATIGYAVGVHIGAESLKNTLCDNHYELVCK